MATRSTRTFRLEGRPRKTLRDLSSLLQIFETTARKKIPNNHYTLDTFRDQVRLGEGSTYVVDRALSVGKEIVAVKRTLFAVNGIREVSSEANQFSFEDQIDILYTEVRALTHPPLREHPNIVNLIGYGWHSSYSVSLPFIVLEFAGHGTLASFLQHGPSKTWSSKLGLIKDVASGLEALHDCKIIHGDVKMQNILTFPGDDADSAIAKLSDFGHTIIWDSTRAFEPLYGGTPMYNAPEVHDQDNKLIPVESMAACDIYSFGLMIWDVIKDGLDYFQDSWLEDPGDEKVDFLVCCDSQFIMTKAIRCLQETNLSDVEKGALREVLVSTLEFEAHDRGSASAVLTQLDLEEPRRSVATEDQVSLDERALKENVGDFGPVELLRTYPAWPDATRKELFDGYSFPYSEPARIGFNMFRKAECHAVGFGTLEDAEAVLSCVKESANLGFVPARLCYAQLQDALRPLSTSQDPQESRELSWPDMSEEDDFPYHEVLMELKSLPVQKQFSHRLRKIQDQMLVFIQQITKARAVDNMTNSPFSFIVSFYTERGILVQQPHDWPDSTSSPEALQYAIYIEDVQKIQEYSFISPHAQNPDGSVDALNTVLFASRLGRSGSIRKIIELGAKASSVDRKGHGPLHYLNMFPPKDLQDVAKTLLHAGADLNCQSEYPELHCESCFQAWGTPLHWAVASSNLDAVRILLDLGADPLLSTLEGIENAHEHFTPLHMAAGLHLPEITEELASRATYTFPGPWPLHMISRAAPFQKWMMHGGEWKEAAEKTVRVLVKHGHLVDQLDHMNQTPLANAVNLLPSYICSSSLVRELLLQGADPNALVGLWKEPLVFMAIDGLEKNTNNVGCLAILLEAGANINSRDSQNHTPLMIAYRNGAYAAAKLLLHWHADINAVDDIQYTALHHAVSSGAPRSAMIPLLQAGAFIDAPCDIGTTPLGIAIASRQKNETTDALISLGASLFVNQRLDPYHNILHHALLSFDRDHRPVLFHLLSRPTIRIRPAIQELLNSGYSVDPWTPLHQAISVADYACVRELVKMGANPELVTFRGTWHGQSAFQLAEAMVLSVAHMPGFRPQMRVAALKIHRYLAKLRTQSVITSSC